MKARLTLLGLLILCAMYAAQAAGPREPAASEDGIEVYFSPHGGCTDAIIACIAEAEKSVKVLAYSFTSAPIAEALLRARDRGVEVTVVLDSSQETAQYSSATFFANQKMNVLLDGRHAIAHNKVMIIDHSTIITGSFNFSRAAEESNSENVLIIRGKQQIVKAYSDNFAEHLEHAHQYQRPAPERSQPRITEPAPPASGGETVYITNSGKKYHRGSCGYLRKSRIPVGLNDAKRRGFTPCSRCRPSAMLPRPAVPGLKVDQRMLAAA